MSPPPPPASRLRVRLVSLAAALATLQIASADQMDLRLYRGCGEYEVAGLPEGSEVQDIAYVSTAEVLLAAAAGCLYAVPTTAFHTYTGPLACAQDLDLAATSGIIGVGHKEGLEYLITTDTGFAVVVELTVMQGLHTPALGSAGDSAGDPVEYGYVASPDKWTVKAGVFTGAVLTSVSWDQASGLVTGLTLDTREPIQIELTTGLRNGQVVVPEELTPSGHAGPSAGLKFLPLTGNWLSVGYSEHSTCLDPPCGTLSEVTHSGTLLQYVFLFDHLGSDALKLTAVGTESTGTVIYIARDDGTVKQFCGGELADPDDLPRVYPMPADSAPEVKEEWIGDVGNMVPCGSLSLRYGGWFDDMTFNPTTSTIWLANNGGIIEFGLNGQFSTAVSVDQMAQAGLDPATGISWRKVEQFFIAHKVSSDRPAVISLLDFGVPGPLVPFTVVRQFPVDQPASQALATVFGEPGVFASFPNSPEALFKVHPEDGSVRMFSDSSPAYSSVQWDSVYYSDTAEYLYGFCEGCGAAGTLSKVSPSGEVVSEVPLDVLMVNATVIPRSIAFVPNGSVALLAGVHNYLMISAMDLYCVESIMGDPELVLDGVWRPLAEAAVLPATPK